MTNDIKRQLLQSGQRYYASRAPHDDQNYSNEESIYLARNRRDNNLPINNPNVNGSTHV